MNIKDIILKYVNKPVDNIISSQTLYEALFANINMYLKYHNKEFENRCKNISQLIVKSQLPDGGFDIGYNFRFGNNMTKKSEKESTTPEVLSIYALLKYYEIFKDESVVMSIKKGMNWIEEKIYEKDDGIFVIPYAPCSYRSVHITNAISFTVATIVYYMYIFKDKRLKNVCDGMLTYMKNELIIKDDMGYWNYFEKDMIEEKGYLKTDNYHIAQQLYYHILLDKYYENVNNKEIIRLVSNYIKYKLKINLAVPYIEIGEKKTKDIHSWGYCSLLLCALYFEENTTKEDIKEYIMKYMIKEDHFLPIIKSNGEVINDDYYPRSDAWVLHALSEYLFMNEENKQVYEIVNIGLEKLEKVQYKGLENHAYTMRKRIFTRCIEIIKGKGK